MKSFILLITVLFCGLISQAQTVNCAKFRNGKFKTTLPDGKIAIIIRHDTHQQEFVLVGKDTLKVNFTVNWIDDCTYTLTPDKEEFIKYPKLPKNAVMTVKISAVKVNSYMQSSSYNFSNKIYSSEMILLPNN